MAKKKDLLQNFDIVLVLFFFDFYVWAVSSAIFRSMKTISAYGKCYKIPMINNQGNLSEIGNVYWVSHY